MEIRDYLRAIRRILWLVIAIPIIAAVAVGGFIEVQPSVYEAQATAIVPSNTAGGISQSAASQYVSTFKDVLTSQTVVNLVAQAGYGVTTGELVTGLSANTVTASSNYIIVTLLGKHGQNLVGAVKQAAILTMNQIAEPQVIEAQNELNNAKTLLATANTAMANFDATYNNLVPLVTYNNEQTTLNNQLAVLQTLKLNGDSVRAAAEQLTINQTVATLKNDATQLQIWQPLNSAVVAAQTAVDKATEDNVSANALQKAEADPNVVTTKNIGRLSKLSDVIKFAAIAFALALLMMLGLILILELMHSGRQRKVAVTSQQGAFAWPPPAAQTRPTGPPAAAAMAAPPAQRRACRRATRGAQRRMRQRCLAATDTRTETGSRMHPTSRPSRNVPAAGSSAADSIVIAVAAWRPHTR